MLDKKYQVFISSSYTDLVEARSKVRDAILAMYHFPVGMEMFGAANEEQWQIISETIDSSDYYVLIIGQRYGSVIPEGHEGAGISYTEKEFRFALAKGIPVLAFILDDSVPVIPGFYEKDNPTKLDAFKAAVKTNRLVEWWKTPDELAQKVTTALYKQITRTKRPGWIRSDSVDIEESLSEIVKLSKQNRELQEENKRLSIELEKLKSSNSRKPLLTLALECSKPDENERYPELFQRDDIILVNADEIHLKMKTISTSEEEMKYQKLTLDSVPDEIKQYVTEEDIKNYNLALPTKDEIQKYIEACRIYKRIKQNGIPITLFIHNIGNAKATDISAIIKFPKQVRVFDIYEIGDLGELKGPKKPENPIDNAKKLYEKEDVFALDINLPNLFGGISEEIDYSALAASVSNLTKGSIFESMEIENNTVYLEQRQGILHTRFDYYEGAYIVPMEPGEYEARVTLMCAEYEEPEETTIKFVVEECN